MPTDEFPAPISRDIWEQKYRLMRDGMPVEATLDETFWRVAKAAAGAETGGQQVQDRWALAFHDAMADLVFLPGGRILAGAGADANRNVTLANCFVLGRIDDDLGAIFDAVKEAALTMQAGGGIGHDFSTLRPSGAPVRGVGATASGPLSFMDVWDAMCRTLMAAGQRRGAMMATLRCDHPDIEAFIAAKADPERLRNFNLSVLVTDAFMSAVKADGPWELVFDGKVYKSLSARSLWQTIARSNHAYAEPGVIFIDRVNASNNLAYCELICATNPCGEQPLPPYGACVLGSINLARLIDQPFTPKAALDIARLQATVNVAVRFLDNIIDISHYPLVAQRDEAQAKRRIGLGVTGLADALIMLGVGYGRQQGRDLASHWMATIQEQAYRASAGLAAQKGAFPCYDQGAFLQRPNVRARSEATRADIAKNGMRNGCLTSIAPTGTISLLAGNVSSGIEPVFDFRFQRRIRASSGPDRQEIVEDYAHARYRALHGGAEPEGDAWVTAGRLTPQDHLAMQAALQPHVDSAISKTINCPSTINEAAFETLYLDAFDLGLKGCTLFRPNAITGSVLTQIAPDAPAPAAVSLEPMATASRRQSGGVVYMTQPLARDAVLGGQTYKLKWGGHGYYITINDIERDGRRRPFEIFINTKDLAHYAWTVALTRMISAVFRRGGDVAFIAEELKAIFDPQGGQWIAGRYVPSLLAAIGGIIESHLAGLDAEVEPALRSMRVARQTQPTVLDPLTHQTPTSQSCDLARALLCPRCSQPDFRMEGSCRICLSCGHSSCG